MIQNPGGRIRHYFTLLGCILAACGTPAGLAASDQEDVNAMLAWPVITQTARPWAYWWWMGSAVDTTNLTRELTRYHDAGMGGVHIIPIYGAKGWEDRYIDYLSPRWMDMLDHTVREAARLGMGVDMTTGTGWCFGGPEVSDEEANASVVWRTFEVAKGASVETGMDTKSTQALVAYGPNGRQVDLLGRVRDDGSVKWTAPGDGWRVCAVTQRPSGQRVKRAAPGGGGHMLNLIYEPAITDYLKWFGRPFERYQGAKPRAQYHDSYEYRSDWSPDFFEQFERRRGYRLQDELPALFANAEPPRSRREPPASGPGLASVDPDHAARVKCDYRQTISDIMVEVTLPVWGDGCHRHGFLTRNEAHGSPGNWLDLYAVADIPETEMFHSDRNKLISKFASSAAHVAGRPLVGCETGTWLEEHFTETLADMKYLLDDLFLSGVNHVFYHGTCYSPDEAGWPGWHFYASYEMNPRNSIWHDVPALNEYVARCQSVLQSGRPDNDVLLYWPVQDLWHDPAGLTRNLTIHARDWFEEKPIGRTALDLWNHGFAFDYVSDRQVAEARVERGDVSVAGGSYQAVVVPPCDHISLETFRTLLALAKDGATVIFERHLPGDVPGWGELEKRRAQFKKLASSVRPDGDGVAVVGRGRVMIGDAKRLLARAGVRRESMFDTAGLMCIRRAVEGGRCYFVANRGDDPVNGWVPLATPIKTVEIMNPLDGRNGLGAVQTEGETGSRVYLQLNPGESVILRALERSDVIWPEWPYRRTQGGPIEIAGTWRVRFIAGGPTLPPAIETTELSSWTALGGEEAQCFAGTARYQTTFDAPTGGSGGWVLDLGRVCQSARVRINGRDLGTLITSPFRVRVDRLKSKDNLLEVEVTNVSANRIRDLDRRGVDWKTFHDINFVNIDYQPFDASDWPLYDSGLLGPVTLTPVEFFEPEQSVR